jgi:hypothetical protein
MNPNAMTNGQTETSTSKSSGHLSTPTLWLQLRTSATRTQIECELLASEMQKILSSPGQREPSKSGQPTEASSEEPSAYKPLSSPSWMTPLHNL